MYEMLFLPYNGLVGPQYLAKSTVSVQWEPFLYIAGVGTVLCPAAAL
jgi:hypothetical protein